MQDSSAPARAETKIGVAVRLEGYEYLPDASAAAATFPRVSVLHQHDHDAPIDRHLDRHLDSHLDEDRPLAHASARLGSVPGQ